MAYLFILYLTKQYIDVYMYLAIVSLSPLPINVGYGLLLG